MHQDSAQAASEGRIIAGLENSQQVFHVPIIALKRSAVIKGYIDDPDSMPESLRKDGALYLPNCDPEVIRTLIHCLKREDYSSSEYEFDVNLRSQDPLFYIKTYKLAMTLAVESLSTAALRKMKSRNYDTQTFIEIVAWAEAAHLTDGKQFRGWLDAYIAKHSETLRESRVLKATIMEGGSKAWVFCLVLMSSLSHAMEELSSSRHEPTRPHPPPDSVSKRSASDPSIISRARHGVLYSQSPGTSPNLKRSSIGGDAQHQAKKRNLKATVEDATNSEDEEPRPHKSSAPEVVSRKRRS
ncbi:hypothetical protein V8E51_017381 [Hyaloscypha variabilis]